MFLGERERFWMRTAGDQWMVIRAHSPVGRMERDWWWQSKVETSCCSTLLIILSPYQDPRWRQRFCRWWWWWWCGRGRRQAGAPPRNCALLIFPSSLLHIFNQQNNRFYFCAKRKARWFPIYGNVLLPILSASSKAPPCRQRQSTWGLNRWRELPLKSWHFIQDTKSKEKH